MNYRMPPTSKLLSLVALAATFLGLPLQSQGFRRTETGTISYEGQTADVREVFWGPPDGSEWYLSATVSRDARVVVEIDMHVTMSPLTHAWKLCLLDSDPDLCVDVKQEYPSVVGDQIQLTEPSTPGILTVSVGAHELYRASVNTQYREMGELQHLSLAVPPELRDRLAAQVAGSTDGQAVVKWLVTLQNDDAARTRLRGGEIPLIKAAMVLEATQAVTSAASAVASEPSPLDPEMIQVTMNEPLYEPLQE